MNDPVVEGTEDHWQLLSLLLWVRVLLVTLRLLGGRSSDNVDLSADITAGDETVVHCAEHNGLLLWLLLLAVIKTGGCSIQADQIPEKVSPTDAAAVSDDTVVYSANKQWLLWLLS